MLPEIEEIVKDGDISLKIIEASKISMGQEIGEIDQVLNFLLC